MSHKVDPRVFRIRGNSDWLSRGYYKNAAKNVEEDFRIRDYLWEKIGKLGVEKIETERFAGKINIIILTARPGLIIGRGGEGVEQLKKELETHVLNTPTFSSVYKKIADTKLSTKKRAKSDARMIKKGIKSEKDEDSTPLQIKIEIREIKDPWLSARLSADWVARQIEKRMPFRKLLKQAMSKIMSHKEVKGARIEVSGRLNGNEIARREWLGQGQLPRQTLRADIDYAKDEAHCTYGSIGIKVWIYNGEKFE